MTPPSARGSVLALHGFTGHPAAFDAVWAHWPPETLWPAEVRPPAFHCPRLAGHGPEPDRSANHFAEEVARLVRLAAELPAPRHLIGYSMGGRVALGVLSSAPKLFSSALVVGAHPGLGSPDERTARAAQEADWRRVLDTVGLAGFIEHFERLPVFHSQGRLAAPLQATLRRARLAHTAAGLSHALRVLGLGSMPDLLPELRRVEIPITLLVGEDDRKFLDVAAVLAAQLRRAELRVVARAGHNLLLEAPEQVAVELARLVCDNNSRCT